jgi:glycosyltransferase involved in cell wall biosynthesis
MQPYRAFPDDATHPDTSNYPQVIPVPTSSPERVLLTGGREIGGVRSFAESLFEGFTSLGLAARVISPSQIVSEIAELRNPRVLKILSTSALYSAPLSRRAICIAHGVPGAAYNGMLRSALIIGSYKLAYASSGAQVIAVSQYTATQLEVFYGARVDAVVLNPVKNVYLVPPPEPNPPRSYITYVGRLTEAKGIARLLPIIRDLLSSDPSLEMCIIGEGPEKPAMMNAVLGDRRFRFLGNIDDEATRDYLRRTRLFVSGHRAEGFGITYLEALSQGCVIAMPAGGGGIEIALDRVARQVHLFPLSFDHTQTLAVLRKALQSECAPFPMQCYGASAVASAYLDVDGRFTPDGRFRR